MGTSTSPISSATYNANLLVAELAIYHLLTGRRLTRLIPHFTPESAIQTLLLTQSDRRLFLSFLTWAPPRLHFFRSSLPLQSLSFLLHCRYRLHSSALHLSRHLALSFPLHSIFNCLSSSLSLFRPPFPSLPFAVDFLIKSYSSLNNLSDALSAVSLVRGAGFVPSLFAYNSILDCMFRSWSSIDKIESFILEMARSGVSLNVYSYNILIRGYCERGELDRAVRFLDEMVRADCSPNVVTFNTLIHWYCQCGKISEASELFSRMEKIVWPNLFTYNLLINGLCNKGKINDAQKMFDKMRERGLSPDIVSYNTLISGYCKMGDVHQAQVSHNKMSSWKGGNFTRALKLVTEIWERGLTVNEITITTIVHGSCKKGSTDDALLVINEIKKCSIKPSVVCYNALIKGYCILGHMNEALEIVKDMEGKGIRPNVVTYSIIISGYCKSSDFDRAEFSKEIVQKGIKPGKIMYASLVHALCKASKLFNAREVFDEMLESGSQINELTYRSLIDCHCQNGDLKSALLLHGKVIKRGALPDGVTNNVLIKSLSKLARMKQAERALNKETEKLLYKAQEKKLMHDSPNYNVIIEHCTKAGFKSVLSLLKGFCMNGLMDEADKVLHLMLERKWKPDASVYSMLIHGHATSGNVGKALRLYNDVVKDGFVPINNERCFGDNLFILGKG
ncbi:hypothetical protein LUZ63_001053 [Rhynchospora breviuscula]|uniref:Pentatricopeptide repeat-containing protein n=1 Tax=Rhynchospora breviuscula TaxID=2022672 RepID=A0A9Q0CW27_9POAL|nr:hypothetical protein LUZ63_001053 [Rhynchospora breviuscula]